MFSVLRWSPPKPPSNLLWCFNYSFSDKAVLWLQTSCWLLLSCFKGALIEYFCCLDRHGHYELLYGKQNMIITSKWFSNVVYHFSNEIKDVVFNHILFICNKHSVSYTELSKKHQKQEFNVFFKHSLDLPL